MNNNSRYIFLVVLLLCIGQAAYYYPLLPDRLASHFDAAGRPNAWLSKDAFFKVYFLSLCIPAILFSTIGVVLRKVPISIINLPNKDYWLAPERKEETIASLSRHFLWFGSATMLLLLDIFHQTFRVNLGRARMLEHPVASLVIYIAFSSFWTVLLIRRFMKRN